MVLPRGEQCESEGAVGVTREQDARRPHTCPHPRPDVAPPTESIGAML